MKRQNNSLVIITVFIILIGLMIPKTANADTGPKPSVVITFEGLENTTYYVTLLSKTDSTGPWSVRTASSDYSNYKEGDEDYDIYLKFLSYEDNDGYYFLQYFSKCNDNKSFRWGYYPPQNFKILLYFPETDSFVVSNEAYERYAFDSYFKVDATGYIGNSINTMQYISAVKSYEYRLEIYSIIFRIIFTIVVEVGIALLFNYGRKKHLLIIGITNILTQTVLNVLLNIVNYHKGYLSYLSTYFVLELLVFAIEAVIYNYYFEYCNKKEGMYKGHPVLYAFVANALSYGIGLMLAKIVPKLF